MILEIGVVLLAATVLVFSWGFAQHRRPVPAAWTRHMGLSSGFTIVMVCLLPGALGAIALGLVTPMATLKSLDPWVGGLMLAVLLLSFRFVPRFVREGRGRAA